MISVLLGEGSPSKNFFLALLATGFRQKKNNNLQKVELIRVQDQRMILKHDMPSLHFTQEKICSVWFWFCFVLSVIIQHTVYFTQQQSYTENTVMLQLGEALQLICQAKQSCCFQLHARSSEAFPKLHTGGKNSRFGPGMLAGCQSAVGWETLNFRSDTPLWPHHIVLLLPVKIPHYFINGNKDVKKRLQQFNSFFLICATLQ